MPGSHESRAAARRIRRELRSLADPRIAEHSRRFFRTGPGEYGEGDRFLGIRVPALRRIAREHRGIALADAEAILESPLHEERLLALLILVLQFQNGSAPHRTAVFDLYCRNLDHVNNWDLVDCSAPHIVGEQLRDRSRRLLHRLARSRDLWRRRIAIVSTFAYIRTGEFEETLTIAATLLGDEHDLIHKAVGWMLREVGKRDRRVEEEFLREHYRRMPRTMLRYAIERFPESKRRRYLAGNVR